MVFLENLWFNTIDTLAEGIMEQQNNNGGIQSRPIPISSVTSNAVPDIVIKKLTHKNRGTETETLEEYEARTGMKRQSDTRKCDEEKKRQL